VTLDDRHALRKVAALGATYPSGQGAGLQNLYSPVRIWSSPPLFFGLVALACSACTDPPDPGPTPGPDDLPRWSTAPHVVWHGGAAPRSDRLLAVFYDNPGGPVDQLAADPDVASFLNDRFSPLFLVPTSAPGLALAPAVLLIDSNGCRLLPDPLLSTPEAWIQSVNGVVQAEQGPGAQRVALPEVPLPTAIALDHPLRRRCQ
jgi:hypothetical protein